MSRSILPYDVPSASDSASLVRSSRPLHVLPTARPAVNPSPSSWPFVGRSHPQPGSKPLLLDACSFYGRLPDISEPLNPLRRSLPIEYSGPLSIDISRISTQTRRSTRCWRQPPV